MLHHSLLFYFKLLCFLQISPSFQSKITPLIQVQSVLIESWESFTSTEFISVTGYSVVVEAMYQTENNNTLPASQETLFMTSPFSNLDIILQENNGLYRHTLVKNQVWNVSLNVAGRFSFTIPLNGQSFSIHAENFTVFLPDLLFRIESLPKGQW